jgi:hypothetical protein
MIKGLILGDGDQNGDFVRISYFLEPIYYD